MKGKENLIVRVYNLDRGVEVAYLIETTSRLQLVQEFIKENFGQAGKGEIYTLSDEDNKKLSNYLASIEV